MDKVHSLNIINKGEPYELFRDRRRHKGNFGIFWQGDKEEAQDLADLDRLGEPSKGRKCKVSMEFIVEPSHDELNRDLSLNSLP